ncbi:hypothetical protein JW988_08725 [Candidatus Bathyarchaeota archaeon]|nr:hypothetical protein [Candidatus Bathyarchaeota archaeon]
MCSRRQILSVAAILFMLTVASICNEVSASISPPSEPVRLIFIHHSCGSNWLSDSNGGLGIALRDNNYYVSDTYYGWGPDSIGSSTDIGHWWLWFRGPDSTEYLNALYAESDQHSSYSRMITEVSGENEVIMFKSCYPNSALKGDVNDPVPEIEDNPLCGQSCGSQYHTVANAKGIYIDLLEYFNTRPDKLFMVVTAPPLTDDTYADNARAFNNWLVDDWLAGYAVGNVFVFDFYNVLTTNGGDSDTNDLGLPTGNHHRWWNDGIQHVTGGDDDANPNVLEYPTGDNHPSKAGNEKATAEFVPLLNNVYSSFQVIPEFSEVAVLAVLMVSTVAVACLSKNKIKIA